jgi:hypothetical protein
MTPLRPGRPTTLRDRAVLVLVPAYMAALLLAGWPAQIRPAFLDPASDFFRETFARVSLRSGLSVFRGTEERQQEVAIGRCVVAMGWDAEGRRVAIYDREPCPTRGFRWKPEVYEQMLFHWLWQTESDGVGAIQLAMADHFCHRLPEQEIVGVELSLVRVFVDYDSGATRSVRSPLGRFRCRS